MELIANPDGTVTAIDLDNGAILQLAITDNGPNGDTIAVTLNKSRGGLWFSSAWDGNRTIERGVQSGDIRITP